MKIRQLVISILAITFLAAFTATADEQLAVLRGGDLVTIIPVGVNDAAYVEFLKAVDSHDTEGYNELVASGRVFMVKDGTRVRILDTGFGTKEVRILSGPHQGQRGTVDSRLIGL